MTNAGDLTWAVELRVQELFDALDQENAILGDIAEEDPTAPPRPPHLRGRRGIAIITGNAPESGIALWGEVNKHIRELLGRGNVGDASMPPIRVASLPELGMTMELSLRSEHVWQSLAPLIEELCRTDIAMVAIACNTTQFFVDRIRALCEPHGVRFINLAEVVADWLANEGVKHVAVIGIPFVADFEQGWSAYQEPFRDFVVEPMGKRTFERLTELAYQVKEEGPSEGGLNKLRAILNQDVESSHVVLALTELSLLLTTQRKAGRSGKVLIDPIRLYGEAIARYWLGRSFPPRSNHWTVTMSGLTQQGRVPGEAAVSEPNEDAVLLAGTILRQPAAGIRPMVPELGSRHELVGDEDRRLWVAVVDGLSGHAAGAEASLLVADRLRAGAIQCDDGEDSVTRLLGSIDEDLSQLGADDRGSHRRPRGATAAGLLLGVGDDPDGSATAVGFVAGDCVLLRVAIDGSGVGLAWAAEGLRPQMGIDGPTSCLGGRRAGTFNVVSLSRIEQDTVFFLCTDGFPRNLGLNVDEELPGKLAKHPLLRGTWNQFEKASTRDSDVQLVRRLWLSGRVASDAETEDDVSVALLRLHRERRSQSRDEELEELRGSRG